MMSHARSRSSSLTTLPPSDEASHPISDTETDLSQTKKALVASASAATGSDHGGTSPAAAASDPYASPSDLQAGSAASKDANADHNDNDSNTPVAGPSKSAKARKKRQSVTDKDKLEWMRLRAEEGLTHLEIAARYKRDPGVVLYHLQKRDKSVSPQNKNLPTYKQDFTDHLVEALQSPLTTLGGLRGALKNQGHKLEEASLKTAIKSLVHARITPQIPTSAPSKSEIAQFRQLSDFILGLKSSTSSQKLQNLIWVGHFDVVLNLLVSLRKVNREDAVLPQGDPKLISNQWEVFTALTKDGCVGFKCRLRSSPDPTNDWQQVIEEIHSHYATCQKGTLPSVVIEQTVANRFPFVENSLRAKGYAVAVLPVQYLSISPIQSYAPWIDPIIRHPQVNTPGSRISRHVQAGLADARTTVKDTWYDRLMGDGKVPVASSSKVASTSAAPLPPDPAESPSVKTETDPKESPLNPAYLTAIAVASSQQGEASAERPEKRQRLASGASSANSLGGEGRPSIPLDMILSK